jgi:hypothetical protein
MLHFLRLGATMQTMAPPEDALEQRFARIDKRFVDVNRRFDEVDRKFAQVNRRIAETAAETKAEVKELKQEVKVLQITFQRGNFALVASVIGVLLATILKGG